LSASQHSKPIDHTDKHAEKDRKLYRIQRIEVNNLSLQQQQWQQHLSVTTKVLLVCGQSWIPATAQSFDTSGTITFTTRYFSASLT